MSKASRDQTPVRQAGNSISRAYASARATMTMATGSMRGNWAMVTLERYAHRLAAMLLAASLGPVTACDGSDANPATNESQADLPVNAVGQSTPSTPAEATAGPSTGSTADMGAASAMPSGGPVMPPSNPHGVAGTLGSEASAAGENGPAGESGAPPASAGPPSDDRSDGPAATESSPESATQIAAGGSLPPTDDPTAAGTFDVEVLQDLPGLFTHGLIAPKDLGRDGIKHPVLVWINGAGADFSSYRNMHNHLAAQGFFIVDDKQSTFEAIPEITSQKSAIDWVVAQAEDPDSPYYGKIDATRIAIGGHSLGSVASFGNVGDPRILTSVHIAGGVNGNPGGVDAAYLENLRVPAAFLCGSRDTNGLPRVREDFEKAPDGVPVFLGVLSGVGHVDEFNQENGGRWGAIVNAWLRWQLAGDQTMAPRFEGADCQFCTGDWDTMKHVIN